MTIRRIFHSSTPTAELLEGVAHVRLSLFSVYGVRMAYAASSEMTNQPMQLEKTRITLWGKIMLFSGVFVRQCVRRGNTHFAVGT